MRQKRRNHGRGEKNKKKIKKGEPKIKKRKEERMREREKRRERVSRGMTQKKKTWEEGRVGGEERKGRKKK